MFSLTRCVRAHVALALALAVTGRFAAAGAAQDAAAGPVLSFSSARTGGVFREPRVEIAAPRIVVGAGDVLAYDLFAPAPGAREIGVELVAADGRRIGAVLVAGLDAATHVRVPLDAWAGVEVRSVELVARGALATSIGFQVGDVRIEHPTTPATIVFRGALASGARHLEDDERGAGVRRLEAGHGFDGALARFTPSDVGEPWHAYDLRRLAFAASGGTANLTGDTIDHVVGPAIPLRLMAGDAQGIRASGQRLGFEPVDGGRSYSIHLAVSTEDGGAASARAYVLAEAGERRALDFQVPARGTLPNGAVVLERDVPAGTFLIELPVVSNVPLRAFELPKDPRIHVHAVTFQWRKEGGNDARFRLTWLEAQARGARELGETRRAQLARFLANRRLGTIFAPAGGEIDAERPLYEALVAGDLPAADALLTQMSAAQVTRAAALKLVRVAFEDATPGRVHVSFAATDAVSWWRAWSQRVKPGLVVLDGDPAEAQQAPQLLARLGVDTVALPAGASLARWKGPDGSVLSVIAPRARLTDAREFGDLPWRAWYERAATAPAEGEVLFGVGDERERAAADEILAAFGAMDVAPRTRRATLESFASEARRRARAAARDVTARDVAARDIAARDIAAPLLRPLGEAATVDASEAAWNARRCVAAVRRLETLAAFGAIDGAPSRRDEIDAAWRAVEEEFGSLATVPAARARADALVGTCDAALADPISVLARGAATNGPGTPVLLVNSLPYSRRELVRLEDPDARMTDARGTELPSQRTRDGARVFAVDVPACGYEVVHGRVEAGAAEAVASTTLATEGLGARNAHLAFAFDASGALASLRLPGDDGELLAEPARFLDDSWSVDSVELVERGPLRAVVCATFQRTVFQQGAQRARVECTLAAHARTLDVQVVTESVDALTTPPPVVGRFVLRRAAARAVVGTAPGATLAAAAADGSAARYRLYDWIAGTDGKSGLAILGGDCAVARWAPRVLSVESLAPGADGVARTTFSLQPFTGGWRIAGLAGEAARVATPVVVYATDAHAGPRGARHSFLSLSRRALDGSLSSGPECGLALTSLSITEAGDAWIVRLCETGGSARELVLATQHPLFGADTLEPSGIPLRTLRVDEGRVRTWIGPERFEDLRLRLRP